MSDKKGLLRSIMHGLKRFIPAGPDGENTTAVRAYRTLLQAKDLLRGNLFSPWGDREAWPATSGRYVIGDPTAPVAYLYAHLSRAHEAPP